MPYNFRFLTPEQRQEIAQQATRPPQAGPVDDAMQAAWEADLAGHMALRDAASDDDTRKRHADAIKTLEQALTKAAALSR